MDYRAKSDDDEELALALKLSQLSPDEFDERVTQFYPFGSASADHASLPAMSPSDEEDVLALTLGLSRLSADEFDQQVAQLHHKRSVPATDIAHPSTPPDNNEDGGLEPALTLSQLLDGNFDGLTVRREARRVVNEALALVRNTNHFPNVWTSRNACTLADH
jgi:hypothetical protein